MHNLSHERTRRAVHMGTHAIQRRNASWNLVEDPSGIHAFTRAIADGK